LRAQGGATQIVKFRGDFENDGSLVIAETDYFSRLRSAFPRHQASGQGAWPNGALHRLQHLGFEHSAPATSLVETWRDSGREKDRPRSFVFMARANPIHQSVLGQWGITVLNGDKEDPEQALVEFLEALWSKVRHEG
jgi:hypothetical protein